MWKQKRLNSASITIALAALAVFLAIPGCDREEPGATVPTSQSSLVLHGAGSTFAYPIYSKWFNEYTAASPGVTFDYQAIGSAGGIRLALQGGVEFAGTDAPVSEQQIQVFKARYNCDLLHLPMALGAVVPCYNVAGLNQPLNFTPEALAGIYSGHIARWNDAELVKANPGAALPDNAIVVVHRSDGSGTTYCWTDYLSKTNSQWKQDVGVGTTVGWPTGRGAEGSKGVAESVGSIPNSIGYVELTYAIDNHLAYGAVKNAAGRFVKADSLSVKAAAEAVGQNMPADFVASVVNSAGEQSYPIASFTWMLIPERIDDAAKLKAMKDFLLWAITTGQSDLEPLHYATLPAGIAEKEKAAIDRIHG